MPAMQVISDITRLDVIDEPSVCDLLLARRNLTFPLNHTWCQDALIILRPDPSTTPPNDTYHLEKLTQLEAAWDEGHALEPHIYSAAINVFKQSQHTRRDHNVIFSGDSGSGKTINAAHLISALHHLIPSVTKGSVAGAGTHDQASLARNVTTALETILEGFGHADTVLNNNSSRFIKMTEIHWAPSSSTDPSSPPRSFGTCYKAVLLEQSRIINSGTCKRFHILESLDHLLTQYRVTSSDQLNHRNGLIDHLLELGSVGSDSPFVKYTRALSRVLPPDQVKSTIEVLVGIITLSHLSVNETHTPAQVMSALRSDRSSRNQVETVADMLGLESYHPSRKKRFWKNSIACFLYTSLFNGIVDAVNRLTAAETVLPFDKEETRHSVNVIRILDIYGFETFQKNGLSQLLINKTNENVHAKFIDSLIQASTLTGREGNFNFSLDTPSRLDATLGQAAREIEGRRDKMNKFISLFQDTIRRKHDPSKVYDENYNSSPCSSGTSFEGSMPVTLPQYAGDVTYDFSLCVRANDQSLPDETEATLGSEARNEMLKSVLAFRDVGTVARLGKTLTVTAPHEREWKGLVRTLGEGDTTFIKCIRLDSEDDVISLRQQLRVNGILYAAQVLKGLLPVGLDFESFHDKYSLLMGSSTMINSPDLSKRIERFLHSKTSDSARYRIDHTLQKVFFVSPSHRHDQLRESKARCTHLELELESCKSDNVKYVTAFDKLVSVLLDDNGKNVHDPDNLQDVVLLILSRFHNVSKAVDGVREQMLAEHETVGHVRSQNRTLQSRLERMQEQVERLEDTLKVKVELEEKLDMMAGTLDGYKDHLKALQIQVQVAKSLEREATRREVEVEKSNKYLKEGMEDLGKCTEHLIKRFLVLHGQSVGLVVERQRQVTRGVVSSVDDHTRKQKQKTKMSVELLWDSKILGKAISKLSERRATTTLKALMNHFDTLGESIPLRHVYLGILAVFLSLRTFSLDRNGRT
ncbi:hypothetical protein TREMEDRAFT_66517 [Tremella mesenterica DSM 1558]|uniref:uncharacterized protein n=1 Tax=Tremella mesenterica (strain ATCC 24925 / CBS 8224 / DSM 1558 / NBRC 9311 / NRRL Y-6157 / RJB 2259-6 / UBC 559-6) TaxID=578456 RepID=UPI00032D01C5|nr:uncharacterized protein TREMEDRAFT_66517 [Tremella mesenterica DSM 1558]EIW65521.1 hypothetical protein TREMEDRAFT_66517 [Tremella mesenterica DSM 1558]